MAADCRNAAAELQMLSRRSARLFSSTPSLTSNWCGIRAAKPLRFAQQMQFRLSSAALLAGVLLSACASDPSLRHPVAPESRVRGAEFRQAIGPLLGTEFTAGNRITTLQNGVQIFPAMLQAIRGAKRTITFETYVYEKGEIPAAFAEALAERARAGVKVHVLIDAHGGSKARSYFSKLRDAGVQLERYHTIWWPDPRRYNNRTHRKLLVVDGKVGFIGGVGIADQWQGNADAPEHWRELHYRLEGPVVAHVQGAFMDNWLKTRGELLHGPDYFPSLPRAGSALAAVFHSSPRKGSVAMVVNFRFAIASARESLLIQNAYFVPSDEMVDALVAATQRGVRVEIIVPGRHIDQKAVHLASRKRWGRLLKAGVKIYEYEPTMIHSKLLIADGLFVSTGSSNLDNRSMRLNDEANLNVLDAAFAAEQTRVFAADRARSQEVTLENYRQRSIGSVPLQLAVTPLEPQL
jgi:cardiolipin synthase